MHIAPDRKESQETSFSSSIYWTMKPPNWAPNHSPSSLWDEALCPSQASGASCFICSHHTTQDDSVSHDPPKHPTPHFHCPASLDGSPKVSASICLWIFFLNIQGLRGPQSVPDAICSKQQSWLLLLLLFLLFRPHKLTQTTLLSTNSLPWPPSRDLGGGWGGSAR